MECKFPPPPFVGLISNTAHLEPVIPVTTREMIAGGGNKTTADAQRDRKTHAIAV